MLRTRNGLVCPREAAMVVGFESCNALREATASSSKPSVDLDAPSTGLRVKLPSGVVGAVDSSKRMLSSESTEEVDVSFMLGMEDSLRITYSYPFVCSLARVPRFYQIIL